MKLPKGISIIDWKNKDGTKQARYRVLINRKTLQVCKTFTDLDKAKEFLAYVNDPEKYLRDKDQEIVNQLIGDFVNNPTMGFYINRYITKYLSAEPKNELEKRNQQAKKSHFNSILKSKVIKRAGPGGMFADLKDKEIYFKDLSILDLDDFVIDSFIREKLKQGRSKLSIGCYLTALNKFLSKFRFIDPEMDKKINYRTVNNYDKDLLKNGITKNVQIIDDETMGKIVRAMVETKNNQMFSIVFLSYFTGMRRSEIIYLTWGQVNFAENYVQLVHTKSGKPRRVYLNKEAMAIIESVDKRKDDPRLFTYSIAGFGKVFSDLMKKYEFEHISFHQLRKNYISRMVKQYGMENSLILAEIMGIANVSKLGVYAEDISVNPTNQSQLLKQIGHSTPQITLNHYLKLTE